MTTMPDPEKDRANTLKAACIQAAATLHPNMRSIDPRECAKIAAELYANVIEIDWKWPA